MRTQLRRVGGSVMVAVPPVLLELLHLQAGDAVEMTLEEGRLVLEPWSRPRYSLDELLAQCDSSAELTAQDVAWLAATPVGRELL